MAPKKASSTMQAELEALARFRKLCLALPETHETGAWGHPNFRAGKRTFAAFEWVRKRPSLAFRLGADATDALLLSDARFFATPYGRGLWASLWADEPIDWPLVETLILQSFRLVAPKRVLATLDERAAPAKSDADDRIMTRHPDPAKSGTRIPKRKYAAVRKAILAAVPRKPPGLPFSELPDAVRTRLQAAELANLGSVNWHTTVVKLDLEARGELVRVPGRGPQRLVRT